MTRATMAAPLAASLLLLAIRLYAAQEIGFGDAEALYACYARHPQPVYLDHPGLIGVVARALGDGDAPSPIATHRFTALLSTAVPWLAALAARAAGSSWAASGLAGIALMLAPEISVGLFGLTPDLALVLLWYAALACSAWGLRSEPGSSLALMAALGTGFATGLACDAKASGVLLLAGITWAWSSPLARRHRRTLAPWAGLALAVILVSPVAIDEAVRGFPMLRHRLVETQTGAGLSARNLGALAGGQLLYVTPPLLFAAFVVGRDLHRRRNDDAVARLLWCVTVATLPLVLLACVSRVAEPHWVAPLYLALPLHLARSADRRSPLVSSALCQIAAVTGACAVAAVHAWVLLPLGPRLLGRHYVARYDLANDLYAWRVGLPLVRRILVESVDGRAPPPVVVGPHWTVCAQVHAGLPSSVLVGCQGPIADDFARWLPPTSWEHAPVILYVTDDRFGAPGEAFPGRHVDGVWQVDVERGGSKVRRIIVARLVAMGSARRSPRPPPSDEAILIREKDCPQSGTFER